jgi:hypothetical protein
VDLQKIIDETSEKEQIDKAVELVHDKYQMLVGVFE